jgi:hypothetical protein
MAGSKPAALPLGDAPVSVAMSAQHSLPDFAACEQHRDAASLRYKPCKGLCKIRENLSTFASPGKAKNKKIVFKQSLTVDPG